MTGITAITSLLNVHRPFIFRARPRAAALLAAAVGVVLLSAPRAGAQPASPPAALWPISNAADPWQVSWIPSPGAVSLPVESSTPAAHALSLAIADFSEAAMSQDDSQPLHAAAVEYSDAYQLRARIHKYASFATLPLFAAEFAIGQSLYNRQNVPGERGGAMKGAHGAVGAAIIALFGVNTVTGAWNMFGEGWNDEHGRTLRLVHGLLMMAADAGFVATAAITPEGERRNSTAVDSGRATHRTIAVASISVATAGYLVMLFGNH